ncbi:E3 ubiquitin-protein ligase CIP8 [Actinidia eriantha]|uniref:E3 ubiquitin-protein ligase CIP8 n=1 Tax=Actinidia eriantha TaxID=165200 RepID=UPI002582B38D|nr:E3 ubiquitin-protein ligase CIP8 [Actinidia eriantha]
MAETRPETIPTPTTHSDSAQYWCYHCDKRVAVETLADLPDVVCHECKNGFVESIAAANQPSRDSERVLRMIEQTAHEDDAPPLPPPEDADLPAEDYLRIELDSWDVDDDDDVNGDGEDDRGGDGENREERDEEVLWRSLGREVLRLRLRELELAILATNQDRSGNENEEERENLEERDENLEEEIEEEDLWRRMRREVLRLRLREFATRAANRRNWAEILTELDNDSVELRVQARDGDDYVGNPNDYVDAAEYDAVLRNLAEDGGGRIGAPAAAKSAVAALRTVEIGSEDEGLVCAICKDSVKVRERVKKLPCGHKYHEDCIVCWLGSRNSCPVCRFELETDDPDYEEQKRRRSTAAMGSGGSSSSGGEF